MPQPQRMHHVFNVSFNFACWATRAMAVLTVPQTAFLCTKLVWSRWTPSTHCARIVLISFWSRPMQCFTACKPITSITQWTERGNHSIKAFGRFSVLLCPAGIQALQTAEHFLNFDGFWLSLYLWGVGVAFADGCTTWYSRKAGTDNPIICLMIRPEHI